MASDVTWVGRKSKHSPKPGSGGYTAEAHKAQLYVRENRNGWYFTVEVCRIGAAATREAAQEAALALAARLARVE